jgi:tripartite-type tricarboxylate transporter receptor subunit TctC
VAKSARPTGPINREDFVPSRLAALASALLVWAASATTPQAQDASRPIRLVIAFPPGGPTDFVGRLIADKAKDLLGQSIIIENKPGANGAIGADYVAKSPPDGGTLFLTTLGAVGVTPHMRTDVRYDTIKDFAPITQVVRNTTLMVVRTESPLNSIKDLTAAAKAKPGEITFASTGVGSNTHLALELYQQSAGVKLVHVPYRGAAPAINDLLAGHVDMLFDTLTTSVPLHEAGKVRIIAVAGPERAPSLPDVPTISESGLPGFRSVTWFGMAGPPKMPAALAARINRDVVDILKSPEMSAKLREMRLDATPGTPEDAKKFFEEETELWGKVIKEANVAVQ